MGVTILEHLADQKPNGRYMWVQNASLKVIYDLVRSHQAEIEEARERGYSWRQIDEACRESWQVASNKATGIVWWKSNHLIEDCYNAMKRGTTAGKARKKEKPLSLEVTVTKR